MSIVAAGYWPLTFWPIRDLPEASIVMIYGSAVDYFPENYYIPHYWTRGYWPSLIEPLHEVIMLSDGRLAKKINEAYYFVV